MLDTAAMLAKALALHRAGAVEDAAGLYRAVLAIDPDQPSALYLHGLLLLPGPEGEAMLARAASRRPAHTESRLALANARHASGDTTTAERLWREVLAIEPGHPGAAFNLANLCCAQDDWRAACDVARAALHVHPAHAPLWRALATALLAGGLPTPALNAADAAIEIDPASPESWLARGAALSRLRHDEPACLALTRALSLRPDCPRTHLNLGNVLIDQDRMDEAEPHLRRAIALDPALAEAHTSLGFLLSSRGRLPQALVSHDRAIALRENFAEAHSNRAATLLLGGDFLGGFAAYEWRKANPAHAHCYWASDRPVWQGEPLADRTILVFCEQGFGDTIMCARFMPLLAARGAAIVLVCAAPLIPLLKLLPGVIALVPRADPRSGQRLAENAVVPPYDTWIDQMSLPLVLGLTPDTIPGAHAYLRADPALSQPWHARLPPAPRIGLAWAGNPAHNNDRRRSMPKTQLGPILAVPGAHFVSLHLEPGDPLPGLHIAAPHLHDFADTAACLACLDLVITVDTAIAHLAGALGRPTWLLLPHAAEWRWLTDRTDTPWYSSMRLFRQPIPGAWPEVATMVAAALKTRLTPLPTRCRRNAT